MTVPADSIPFDDEPARSSAAPRWRRLAGVLMTHHRLILAIVLLVLFVGLRLAYLTADPPRNLPNHARIYELFTDPPAKSYEARNRALFGDWAASPADNYQFWRLQAPVWVYPLSWFYRLFGVGYAQMRIYSTLCAASGLLVLLALAARRLRGGSYLLAGSFLTFNYYYIIYGRSGLLEALLNTFVILTVLCLFLAQRRLVWLLAAEWALVLSFLTKQSGLYVLPLCLIAGGVAYVRHLRRGVPRWLAVAPVAQAAAIVGFLSWYVLRDAYWRTVTWNYGHMLFNEDATKQVALHRFPLFNALDRLRSADTWDMGFYSLFPVAGMLATIEVARIAWRAARRRRVDAWELIVAGWGVSSFGVLLLTPLLAVHYRLILFPPIALLAANLVETALRDRWMQRRAWLRAAVTVAALSLDLLLQGKWYLTWVSHRAYDMAAATQRIREAVGNQDEVFAGMWSGPLVFDTRHKYFYIKTMFNAAPAAIAELKLTCLLELDKGDLASHRLWRHYPDVMMIKEPLLALQLRGHTVRLFRFQHPPW
jgi:4-amino-4-deoxy-L-arabinose transferase-like glycosyltransferase